MNWPIDNNEYYKNGSSCTNSDFVAKFTQIPYYLSSWTENIGFLEGKRVLDYGCHGGEIACGVALFHNAREVLGVDFLPPAENLLPLVKANAGISDLPKNLTFSQLSSATDFPPGEFDFIYSWSRLELVEKALLPKIIQNFYNALSLGGRVLIQFGRPYYSSLGSHLSECGIGNWEHLTTPISDLKKKVMSGTSFSESKKLAIWERFESLNKMTPSQLCTFFSGAGFHLAKSYIQTTDETPPKEITDLFIKDRLVESQFLMLFVKA